MYEERKKMMKWNVKQMDKMKWNTGSGKKNSLWAMLLVMILVLSACGQADTSADSAGTTQADTTQENAVTNQADESDGSLSDGTAEDVAAEAASPEDAKLVPDRKAEVSGIVKSIVGNEVTIALLAKSGSSETGTTESADAELTDEEKAEKQAANQAARESGEKGSGSGTGMTDVELSGETVDIIIPVGTTVVKSSGVGDGEFITLNIADIYKGDSVKIWVLEGGESEVELAEFVQVLSN